MSSILGGAGRRVRRDLNTQVKSNTPGGHVISHVPPPKPPVASCPESTKGRIQGCLVSLCGVSLLLCPVLSFVGLFFPWCRIEDHVTEREQIKADAIATEQVSKGGLGGIREENNLLMSPWPSSSY